MYRRQIWILSAFLFFFACNSALGQEKLYLSYFEAINLPDVFENSTTKVYRNHLEETKRFVIIPLDPWDSTSISENSKTARERAEVLAATYYIIGQVINIGNHHQVNISLHRTSDGSQIWQLNEMAGSEDDILILLKDMAKRSGVERTYESELRLKDLTDASSEKRNSKKVVTSFGFSVGGAMPFVQYSDKFGGGLGVNVLFDAGNFIYDARLEGFSSNQQDLGYLSVDVKYPFGHKSSCFFVLGGVGYGSMNYDMNLIYENLPYDLFWVESTGTMGFLGGGYILNRGSGAQIHINLKGSYSFFKVMDSEDLLDHPIGVIFTTGIAFH